MSWLVCDGTVLASLEIADTRATRRRGLLGRDGIEGAILLRPIRSVHTVGMRFPIDVAWCDETLTVLRLDTVVPLRVPRPVWRARAVIETEAGNMRRWGVEVGQQLEIKA